MERGDIYLVSLDPTSGHEQQGRRPVLIVFPAAFNRLTKTPVVLPITSRGNFVRTAGRRIASCRARRPWAGSERTRALWSRRRPRLPPVTDSSGCRTRIALRRVKHRARLVVVEREGPEVRLRDALW